MTTSTHAIRTSEIHISGMVLRVHDLAHGPKVIDPNDFRAFTEAIGRVDFCPTEAELVALSRVARGGK